MPFAGGLFLMGFVVSLLLAGLALYSFLRRQISIRQFVFWEGIFLVVMTLAAFPGLLDWLAGLIRVIRGLFTLAAGLLVTYILLYHFSVNQRQIEKQIRSLSQEIGLLRYQLEYLSGSRDESGDTNNDPQ